jgi:ATP-dependent Clp protease protease subunit
MYEKTNKIPYLATGKNSKPWAVRNDVNGDGEIDIFAPIGHGLFFEGYSFEMFMQDLSQLEGDITVNIKSYGGNVHEALGIYDYMQSLSNKVTTRIWGAAASAATIIALAGDERLIAENARYLIHKPMVDLVGVNTDDIVAALEQLEDYDRQLIEVYEEKTELTAAEIIDLMRENKFISAQQALEMGFVDGIIERKSKENKINNQKNEVMSKKLFEMLAVSNEAEATEKVNELKANIARMEEEKEKEEEAKAEEEEEEKKEMEEKEKEIEDLKAEIAKLKEQIKEKDAKNVVDSAIREGKINAKHSKAWMERAAKLEVEDLKAMIDAIEAPKQERIIDRINQDSPDASKKLALKKFKDGEITAAEYAKALNGETKLI